jgi:hypothetical protein
MIWSRNRPGKRWCPAPGFWPKVCAELPGGVDRKRFCHAVEQAVDIYLGEAESAPPWPEIIKSFDRVLGAAHRFNSQHGTGYRLNDVGAARQHAAFQLQLAQEKAKTRRERLYDNLIIACAGVGELQPSDSNRGPMTRTLKVILDAVLPDAGRRGGVTARGVRDIIRRHLDREGGSVQLGRLDSLTR